MPARTRRSPLARLVVVLVPILVVVAGVLVGGGNTLGRRYLEQQVSDQLVAKTDLTASPTVEIRDSVVVWSMVRQRFDHVRIVLPGLALDQVAGVRTDLDVVLRDVTVRDGYATVVAGSLSGTSRFTWDQVSTAAGFPVAPASGGRVAASYRLTVAGLAVTAEVTARPTITSAGELTLVEPDVSVAGYALPPSLVQQVVDALIRPVSLPLPQGIRATEVEVRDEGLVVALTGTDVEVTALR